MNNRIALAFLLVAAGSTLCLVLWGAPSLRPPAGAEVPSFALTTAQGRLFQSESLQGQVWVASFIFTRCPSSCPLIMGELKALQERFADADGLRLVSFSVDPEHDTPEVLARFGTQYGVDPGRWLLLTGPAVDIDRVATGLRLPFERGRPGPEGLAEVAHSGYLALVGPDGRVRGYFETAPEGLEALQEAMAELALASGVRPYRVGRAELTP